jgi:hypothetical protein
MQNKKHFTTNLILVLALVTLFPRQAARAAGITVTTTGDVLDAAGSCSAVTTLSLPGPDGVTSLREAMCAANNNAGPDMIQFDIPGCESGCTIQPTIALPVLTEDATTIDGYTQDGASPATGAVPATLLVEIDGSAIASNNGFNITSGGNEIHGLAINRFPLNGVAIGGSDATGNVIAGNHIGTDLSGSVDLGNGLDGVFIGLGAQGNTVGSDGPAERNVISGNDLDGVAIHGSGTMGNRVSGNFIGVTADGWDDCANGLHGVYIYGGARVNLIGGDIMADERNVISGNDENGVCIYGDGTTANIVVGNFIGPNASGMAALPNGQVGVMITEGARDNVIGGEATYGNLISGNATGVWIDGEDTTGNRVQYNVIGLAMNMEPLGNTQDGVHLSFGAQNNTVGPENLIVFNGDDGVGVDTPLALGNTITRNCIAANGGLGIHLTNGAHNGITAPIILSASGETGSINGTACPGCTVEVFYSRYGDGEGSSYLGSAVANGVGSFALAVSLPPYPYLTATATDSSDGTSEFSEVFIADIPILYLPLVMHDLD